MKQEERDLKGKKEREKEERKRMTKENRKERKERQEDKQREKEDREGRKDNKWEYIDIQIQKKQTKSISSSFFILFLMSKLESLSLSLSATKAKGFKS